MIQKNHSESKLQFSCFISSRYYRVLKKIFHQRSPTKIQDCYDDAVNLHSLEASSNSFFQVVIQIYFLLLLVVFGTGTIISGVDALDVFKAIGEMMKMMIMIAPVSTT